MPSLRLGLAIVCLAVPLLATASIDPLAARRELDAAETVAEHNPHRGLRQLEALQARLGAALPYSLQRDMLRAQVWILEDTGDLARSFEVEKRALQLALEHQDADYATLARLSRVRQLLSENRADAAGRALAEIGKAMPAAPQPKTRSAFTSVQGDVHNASGQYDQALGSYLKALALEQDNPKGGERRANLLVSIAQVHANTDNPAKAVEAARQGLQES